MNSILVKWCCNTVTTQLIRSLIGPCCVIVCVTRLVFIWKSLNGAQVFLYSVDHFVENNQTSLFRLFLSPQPKLVKTAIIFNRIQQLNKKIAVTEESES